MLGVHKLFLSTLILLISLLLKIVGHLNAALSFLLALLLFGDSKFFISEFPELSEFNFLTLGILNFLLLSVNLVFSALFNGILHLSTASFLLFEKLSSFVLSFGHLFVKSFFLLITNLHELLNLTINKSLSDFLLLLETFSFLGLLKML